MRLHIKTTPNSNVVSFDYQKKMVGRIHSWLGNNKEHGKLSLYSFSWLHKGHITSGGFDFPRGSQWFMSFYDDKLLKAVMAAVLKDPLMFDGLVVTDLNIEPVPDLSNRDLFYLGSPILIKRYEVGNPVTKYYTYEDLTADDLMKETLLHKMEAAGLIPDESVDIRFDREYANKKIKYASYRGICNTSNMCPVYIFAKPETKEFAWNVGIGNSTGIGFGAIY